MKKPAATIVIPTYNEADNCALLIPALAKVIPTAQIVVVDDQSPDGTAQVIQKLSKKFPQLHLVQGAKKQGRGAAVRQGFTYALAETEAAVFIEMDADFSHQPVELPGLVAAVTTPQTVVIASRYTAGGKVENWPLLRRLFSRLANALIATTTQLPLHDNTNGFRAYHRQALQVLQQHQIHSKSYLCLTETVLILRNHGFSFTELASVFPNRVRGESNTSLQEVTNNLRELYHLTQHYAQGCTCHAKTN